MKKVKYFLFGLICVFSCSVVFAENEVVIKSITPVYDENSGVVVTNENNQHGVIFNDRNQSVKYYVVIENTTNNDLKVNEQNISSVGAGSSYEVEGLKVEDVVKANSTKEIVISLNSGTPENGWKGRNFKDTWTAKFGFVETGSSNIINPNTGTSDVIIVILICGFLISCAFIVICRKKKITRYVVILLAFGSGITITNAKEYPTLQININVAYESQNVMKMAYSLDDSGNLVFEDYWAYREQIKNFYISNEMVEIKDYTEIFDVSENKNGRVMAYLVANKENSSYYDLYLQANGIIYPNSNASNYFRDMKYLDLIENMDGFDTSNVTNMSYMFYYTGENSTVFTLDLGDEFDTSYVTNMESMFNSTGYNSTVFTLDLGDEFDTSNVTTMYSMFNSTGKQSPVFTLDLGDKFDTSNVTNMIQMFRDTGANSSVFTLDLGKKFDTSKVTNMGSMFNGTGYNSTKFTLNLGDEFNTSNVTNMGSMFNSTGYNSTVFKLDLRDKFYTSNVTIMTGMFHLTGFSSPIFTLDLGDNFDTSNVIYMSVMFYGTGANSQVFTLDLGDNFNTRKVTTMRNMFNRTGERSIRFTLDLGDKFNTINVEEMDGMFERTGYYSSKLNVSITIRNPNLNSFSNIFKNVAVTPGSRIIVNYTWHTKALVSEMLKTKTSGANVIPGVQVS